MAYLYRIFVIIPETDRDAANAIAAQIDPDFGGDQTFGTPNLSADGSWPGTHILIATAATETMRSEMLAALGNWQAAGLTAEPQFWQCDLNDDALQASNVTPAAGQTFVVTDVFAASGLQLAIPDNPPS